MAASAAADRRVEISIMEETQSRWLAFQRGDTDIEYQLCRSRADLHDRRRQAQARVRAARHQARAQRRSGDHLHRTSTCRTRSATAEPVGGFSKEKIALRRAIAMAYKVEDQIRIIRKGQAVRAQYPIPPGVAGHDPEYRSSIPYDPRAANALLDKFGYQQGRGRLPHAAGRQAARRSATRRRRPSATASSTS